MRRNAFVMRAATLLSPVDGLVPGRVEAGDVVVLWQAAPTAPVSAHEAPDECSVVIGDALLRGAAHRVTAAVVCDSWTTPSRKPHILDGFHVAIAVHGREVTVGCDVLGLFPVYSASHGDVLLVGSSSLPFDSHPMFVSALDVYAMAGHLLTGGPFDGRTLRRGVTRLAAGARLRWLGRAPVTEEPHYTLPYPPASSVESFDSAVERFDAALHAAVRRHTGVHADLALMLSGGRDSRLLAGYLARDRTPGRAITFGVASDYEASCAAGVARSLGLTHQVLDIRLSEFLSYAERTVRFERLAGGMSSVHTWGASDAIRGAGGGILSGYLLEVRQLATLFTTFDGLLQWLFKRAISPDALRALFVGAHREVVDDVIGGIRAHYDAGGGDGQEQSVRWFTTVNARFHAGATPWRLSFGTWPVLPILDQQLLETTVSMPPGFVTNRRMEGALLRNKFSRLARLALDRNSHDVSPFAPSLAFRARAALRERFGPRATPTTDIERRYYVRMYDFDNAGWQDIRRAAEPGRAAMSEWFEQDALAALVPPPGQHAGHADGVLDGFAPKILVGLMHGHAGSDI